MAEEVKIIINTEADPSGVNDLVEDLKAITNEVDGLELDAELSDQSISEIQRKLENAKADALELGVTVDEQDLNRLEQRIDGLKPEDVSVGVSVDTSEVDKAKTSVEKLFDSIESGDTDLAQEAFDGLADAARRFQQAIQEGDAVTANSTIGEFRNELNVLKEATEAAGIEGAELTEQLQEADKALADMQKQIKKSGVDDLAEDFKEASKEAGKAEKSLTKIERLQVAEALSQIASDARSAGEGFSDLGDDALSTGEKLLTGAQAIGDAASAIGAGFAAGGPIGAAIAALGVGVSLFVTSSKKAAEEINKAFGGDLDTSFKQSEASIKRAEQAVNEYSQQISRANAELDEQQRKLEANLALELEKARIQAEIDANQRELDRLEIIGDASLKDEERAKKLAEIDKQQIQAEAEIAKQQLQAEVKSARAELASKVKTVTDLQAEVDRRVKALITNNVANGVEADGLEALADKAGSDLRESSRAVNELFASAVTNIIDSDLQDEFETFQKELNNVPENAAERNNVFVDLINKIKSVPEKDLDSEDKALLAGLEKAVADFNEFQELTNKASDSRSREKQINDELKETEDALAKAKKDLNENDEQLNERINGANARLDALETITGQKTQIVEKKTNNNLAQAEQQAQREAERQLLKEQSNSGSSISDEATRLAGDFGEKGKLDIQKGFQTLAKAYQDGALSAVESQNIAPFLNQLNQSQASAVSVIKTALAQNKKINAELKALRAQIKNNVSR